MNRYLFTSLLFFPFASLSQDPHFTQNYLTPLQLNPAFAGSAGLSRFVTTYRNQWPGLQGNYVTYNFSYDQPIHRIKSGIGINLMHDAQGGGILKSTWLGFIYCKNIFLNERIILRPSFQASFFQKTIDWSKATFGDMIDPRYGFIYNTREVPVANGKSGIDFSTGLLINNEKWNAGIGIHHLTQPDEGLLGSSKLPRKYSIHGSYVFSKTDSSKFSFAPSVLLKWQGPFQSQIFTANFIHKNLRWGIGYRTGDAVLLMLGLGSKYFRFSYSYDLTISELSTATGGTHEMTMAILLNHKNKVAKGLSIKEVLF